MGRYQAQLEQKGHLLGRIVDIGAELYAISAAITYAIDAGHRARRASWPTCSPTRPAAAPTGSSTSCGPTTTPTSTRPPRRCSTGRYTWFEADVLDPAESQAGVADAVPHAGRLTLLTDPVGYRSATKR